MLRKNYELFTPRKTAHVDKSMFESILETGFISLQNMNGANMRPKPVAAPDKDKSPLTKPNNIPVTIGTPMRPIQSPEDDNYLLGEWAETLVIFLDLNFRNIIKENENCCSVLELYPK